ncbi:MAG: MATE family efflux transporter [Oscillospiraceae bacterium]|nr:MATE family efflux transporter [Oscillospiraceae bacterium]
MEENKNDFTQGSILKKLLKFMLPILGALVLQAMYGAVDVLVVGKFGTTSGISAVSTGSSIVNMIIFTVAGLSMGVTVLIGRYIGEKNEAMIGKLIGGATCFFAALSVALAVILLVFARPIARLMQAPEEALDLTVSYIRICGGGIAFIIAYNVISGIFRGMGNSRLPLIFVIIACVVNIAGDLLFVAVFGMNVVGAALATVLAQAVSVALSLVIIRREKLPFKISRKDFRFNGQISKFVRVGSPIAFQELMTNISFLALCAFINKLGLEASSGYGVANKITAFVMLVPSSLMQSLAAFIAQNVGAGLEKRARKTMLCGIGAGAFIGTFVMLLVFFKGDLLSYIFASDPKVIARSAEYLKGFALEAIVTSVLFSFMGYFNGHNQTLWVMIQGLAQTFLVRLPVSWYMSIQENASLTMIGIAAPCATIFGIILNAVYYRIYTNRIKGGLNNNE